MGDARFTVMGPPTGKGRPRASSFGGRVRLYTDARTAAYEDRVAWAAREAFGSMARLEGPVCVSIVTYRERPAKPARGHESRSGLLCGEHRYCTAKPDADNVAKSVLDGCNLAGVWRDDVQVVDLRVLKLWAGEGESPRTEVEVSW